MTNDIHQQFFYPNPPAEVWEYLTNSDLMTQWLMKNNFILQLGYEFQFFTNPIPGFNFDGNIYCTVLEIIPFKKLSYSWKGGPGDGTINMDSIVTWTLTAKDDGTELDLLHTGFKEINIPIVAAMRQGWLTNMKKIADKIKH